MPRGGWLSVGTSEAFGEGEATVPKVRVIGVCLTAVLILALNQSEGVAAPHGAVIETLSSVDINYEPARATAPATWTGTLRCVRNCEGVPVSGTFQFQATNTSSTRSGSCVPKTATGILTINWDDRDGSTTVANNLTARSHGTKELAFRGVTDPRLSDLFANAKIKGTLAFPESDSRETAGCTAGSVPVDVFVDAIVGPV